MSDVNIGIDFSTNASVVKQQIKDLNRQVHLMESNVQRLSTSLDRGNATSRMLTGDIRARKTILKLDNQIGAVAEQRVKQMSKGYNFGAQDRHIKGLMKTNEIMRIQRKIMDDNATAMLNMGKNTQWAGRQLVVGFTVPLTIAAGLAMKAFSDLEKEMVRFKRVYGDAFTSTEELKKVSKEVGNLAGEWTKYGVAVSDTIDLAAEAAGAGFTGNQLVSQINAANKIAVLGELDKQKAMKATIALQSTFKMSNNELSNSINYLNQLENQTMVTMDDMTTAIPKAATVVQGLGGDIQDLGVFMAAMAEGGVTAAEGANALKSGLGSLLNPSVKAKKELKSIGVVMDDLWAKSEENGQGVMYVVEQMADAMNRLGQTQKQMVIEELFGKHQFARMNALLSNINTGAQALQSKEVAGTSQLEAAMIAQRELGKLGESNLTKFQAAVQKLKAEIAPLGETIMGAITPFITGATKIIEWFNKLPDVFKNAGLALVAGIGIGAPIFLMLLGQIQNLLGNGLKLLNWMRNFGKNTKWVAAENLTLADSLSKVDARLIAENKLLSQNNTLLERNAMARHGVAAAPPPSSGRRRFASGGTVPGTGNGDTVPALLTPGEFVVNKAASRKFGGLLNMLNGGVQKFADGGWVQAHLTAPKQGVPTGGTFTPSERRRLGMFQKKVSSFGVDPNMFMSSVSNLTRPLPYEVNAALNSKTGIPANELLKFFGARGINAGRQPMAQALWSAGADRNRIAKGDFIGGQKEFDSTVRNMLRRRGAKPITDAQLYGIVESVLLKMAKSGKNPEFLGLMGRAGSQVGQSRTVKASELTAIAAKHGKVNPYELLLREGSKGMRSYSLKGAKSFRSWGSSKWMSGLGFANGGFVPGTGNTDSVPAMLTPGESVINKKASQQFAPFLQAINSGRIKMLAGGEINIDKGAPTSVRNMVKDNFFSKADLEAAAHIMAKTFGVDVAKMLPAAMSDYDSGPVAAHHKGTIDPATGKKIYPSSQIVSDSAVINNLMEQSTPQKSMKNFQGLNKAAAQMTAEMLEGGASMDRVQKEQARYARVLGQLADGQHVMVKKDRQLLAKMGNRAVANGGMSEGYGTMLNASMPGLGLGVRNAKGEKVTRKVQRRMRTEWNAGAARGEWVGTRNGAPDNNSITPIAKGGRRMDPYAMMMLFSMFGAEISSVTDKMGKLGTVLTTTMSALMTAQMLGVKMPMGGGLKGIIGRGAVGSKVGALGQFAKFGTVAGGVGGLVGGIAGSAIGDKIGGPAGSAVKWGATGAGLGMMFGPWGAAIGGAVGALAGFTIAVREANKAQEKAAKTIETTSVAYSNISDQLQAQYDIGGGITRAEFNAGAGKYTQEQTDLSKQLADDLSDPSGAWQRTINDLKAAQGAGRNIDIQAQLDMLAMEQRGRGTDEASIKVMTDSFGTALATALKDGSFNAASNDPRSTQDILEALGLRSVEDQGNTLITTLNSLETQLVALDTTAADYEEKQKGLNKDLNTARVMMKAWEDATDPAVAKRILSAPIEQLISINKGQGMTKELFSEQMDSFDGSVSVFAEAAALLLEGGRDIVGMAQSQVIALAEIEGIIAAADVQKSIAQGNIDSATADRTALRDAKAARDKDLADNANLIGIQKQRNALDVTDAKLNIAQINIEEGALAKFIGKFNKAFGTSIDSFADAQFQIDKIGAKIQKINLKIIAPLQEKVDDMNRLNELAQRRLADLEEKKQERIDAINESYDDQAKALERIRQQNEYIASQQKANITLADSLSKGDLAGAAGAMVEASQNQAQYAATLSEQRLADSRDAALTNDPADAKIDKLKASIEARSKRIEALEDRIYNINEKQVEPLQRRADLMGLMLTTDRMLMENQKANAMGLDEENFQREKALNAAQEALENTKEQRTVEDDILDTFREQRSAIKKKWAAEVAGAKNVENVLDSIISKNEANLEAAQTTIDQLTPVAKAFAEGLDDGVKALQQMPKSNSVAEILKAAIMATDPKVANEIFNGGPSTQKPTPQKAKDALTRETYNGYIQSPMKPKWGMYGLNSGGPVPGVGNRDTVPAMLTPGEFVMRKDAVKRLGVDKLYQMNQGGKSFPETYDGVQKFAKGGLVNPNFLGTFGDVAGEKLLKKLQPAVSAVSGASGASGATSTGPIGKITGTAARGAGGAVDYLLSMLGASKLPLIGLQSVLDKCLTIVGLLYGKFVGAKSAPSAIGPTARIAGMKRAGITFNSGYNAPKGAMYWYGGGTYGHVGFADGKGNVVGNYSGNRIEKRDARLGGRSYYGWTTKMANGGLVPGSTNYDSVSAALMPGEFVMNRSAVNAIGTGPLRAMNEGKIARPAPSTIAYADPIGSSDTIVYNNYDLAFTINDASDPYEVANVVVRQFERASKSKVRNRNG